MSESCFNCKKTPNFIKKTVSLLCVKTKSWAHKQLTFYFQMRKYFCRHLHSSLISMGCCDVRPICKLQRKKVLLILPKLSWPASVCRLFPQNLVIFFIVRCQLMMQHSPLMKYANTVWRRDIRPNGIQSINV